jgi:phospho-N-acetylmuramoyl-pentapeptide-transferase
MGLNSLAALVVTLLVTAAVCPLMIKRMKLLQYGQQIRIEGPARHSSKAGTPTMGGLILLFSASVVSLIIVGFSPQLKAALLVTLGCGLLGFLDDYFKIARSQSLGLKARSKLIGLILITLLLVLLLRYFNLYSSQIMIPFFNQLVDISYFYPFLIFLLITGFSNSVNLTDGLDGLAAGTAAIAFSAYAIIAYYSSLYDLTVFSAAMAGACLGFLFYNRHPARLFMGDVGSLALGGALAVMAVLTKSELFLLIIGAVFFIEALSVIGQVISFQMTGRRIFLMSPLHHHFELKGWSEWMVVISFWSAGLLFAIIGVLAFSC